MPKRLMAFGKASPSIMPNITENTILLYPIADTSPVLPKVNALVRSICPAKADSASVIIQSHSTPIGQLKPPNRKARESI